MTKLLSEIVSDAVTQNPSAPSEVIVNGIISSIEHEILPAVLRRIRIPKFPSPAEIKFYELKQKRIKKKFKGYPIKDSLALWQQFEYVKHQLNGHKDNYTSLFEEIEFGSNTIEFLRVEKPFSSTVQEPMVMKKDGMAVPEDRLRRGPEKPSRLESILPYPLLEKKEEKRVTKFTLSEELRNNIVSDQLWRDLIAAIEVDLRKIVSSYTSTIDFDISLRKDVEIPRWQKTILSIDAPEMNFERKMILWDIIDSRVRETIQERMRYLSQVERKTLERLNRNLFTKMELS